MRKNELQLKIEMLLMARLIGQIRLHRVKKVCTCTVYIATSKLAHTSLP